MRKYDQLTGLVWFALGVGMIIEAIRLELGHLNHPGPGFVAFSVGVLFLRRENCRRKEDEIMFSKGKRVMVVFLIGISSIIGLFPKNSLAQEPYPTKPITMVIRSGAGGMADIMTRLICKGAEKELGQPILCENRAGAGGVVGVSYVLKSKPDGYTLGASTNGPFTNSPHMEKVPYDPLIDVAGVMVYFQYTHALCVRADAPWNTFEDVLAYAKQNPGKLTYGAAGVGGPQQIIMERIAMKEGIKWSYVPFKSGAEPVIACLGGHINAAAQGPADVVSHIEAGKLKLLLPLNNVRWPIARNVPTVSEKYGFFVLSLQAVYGPKALPEYIIEKLQNVFKKAMGDPSYVESAKALNVVSTYMSGKDFQKFLKSEYDEMGKVLRAMGLGKK